MQAIDIRPAAAGDEADVFDSVASNGDSLPWADASECGAHLRWMAGVGGLPVVAHAGDRVVGAMDLWWGEDVPEIGQSLDVSTLYVHKDWQHRGIGSELIRYAMGAATARGCPCVSVWADRNAEGFYAKQGFSLRLSLQHFALDTRSVAAKDSFVFKVASPVTLTRPRGRDMQTQRILHPVQRWHDLVTEENKVVTWCDSVDRRPVLFYSVHTVGRANAVAIYRLRSWKRDPETAELYLWSPARDQSVLLSCVAHARVLGIRNVQILAYGEVATALRSICKPAVEEEHVLVASCFQ